MRATASVLVMLLTACANRPGTSEAEAGSEAGAGPASGSSDPSPSDVGASGPAVADVTAVEVSGSPGGYAFAVTLRSPDTGCDRYADWWEVLDAEGGLLYRRILAHSHVDEQPFTRSGGPVPAEAADRLWIRAHMQGEGTSPDGYGGRVLTGSVEDGFSAGDAEGLTPQHETEPLPDGCAF